MGEGGVGEGAGGVEETGNEKGGGGGDESDCAHV